MAHSQKCQAKRGSPKPGSLTTWVPSALTVPVPQVCQVPATRSKNQRSALVPGAASVTFGNEIGKGWLGTAPPGWIVKSMGAVTPGGKGIGVRSTGTGVIVIWETGVPSGPMIRVPPGMVTSSPGIEGVVAFTSAVVKPPASSGSAIGCAVSSTGRESTKGTREG